MVLLVLCDATARSQELARVAVLAFDASLAEEDGTLRHKAAMMRRQLAAVRVGTPAVAGVAVLALPVDEFLVWAGTDEVVVLIEPFVTSEPVDVSLYCRGAVDALLRHAARGSAAVFVTDGALAAVGVLDGAARAAVSTASAPEASCCTFVQDRFTSGGWAQLGMDDDSVAGRPLDAALAWSEAAAWWAAVTRTPCFSHDESAPAPGPGPQLQPQPLGTAIGVLEARLANRVAVARLARVVCDLREARGQTRAERRGTRENPALAPVHTLPDLVWIKTVVGDMDLVCTPDVMRTWAHTVGGMFLWRKAGSVLRLEDDQQVAYPRAAVAPDIDALPVTPEQLAELELQGYFPIPLDAAMGFVRFGAGVDMEQGTALLHVLSHEREHNAMVVTSGPLRGQVWKRELAGERLDIAPLRQSGPADAPPHDVLTYYREVLKAEYARLRRQTL